MKQLALAIGFAAAATLGLQDGAWAHGGTYRGPQDTVPPGGGGGGGGGGPTTPGPSGPSGPGASSPGAGKPGTPGAPTGGPTGPRGPRTGGAASAEPDLTVWQYWWGFNKEPYLDLKRALRGGFVVTGNDDYYLGRGEQADARNVYRPSEALIRGRIVPALIHVLRTEQSNDLLTGAMIALAKIGDSKTEGGAAPLADELRPFLTNGQQEVAETAAICLGILANPENTDLLIAMVRDDLAALKDYNAPEGPQFRGAVPTRSRAFAAFALGLIGNAAVDEDVRLAINAALFELVEGEGKRMPTRDVQVACLTSMGLTPLAVAPHWEAPSTDAARWTVPQELRSRQDQIRFLVGYYNDELANNHLIRAHAPTALARLLVDLPDDFELRAPVAELLMAALGEHSKQRDAVQQSCALALGVLADADDDALDVAMREALAAVKDDLADQQTRNFALIALAQAAGRPGLGARPLYAASVDPRQERGALNVRAYLQKELVKGHSSARPWAGIAIGVMERALAEHDALDAGHDAALLALAAQMAEARAPDSVGALAVASGIARNLRSMDAMLERLDKTRETEARGYVAVGLGLLGERSSIAPIQEVVRASKFNADLLKQAAIALGLLGDEAVVRELLDMLANAGGLSAQASLSSALGFIGDTRSVEPLIEMMLDEQTTALARGFAAAALGIVADKEDLPWNSKIGVGVNYRAATATLTSGGKGVLDIL